MLFSLHFNNFFKTLLTHSICRGIFLVNPIDFVDWFKFIHKILPGHPCLLEQRGRPAVTCRGGGPSILLTQDRSVAQKPHWGFCCCANAAFCFPKKQKIRTLLLLRKGSDFHYLVRVVIQHFLKTIVVQFVFEVIG